MCLISPGSSVTCGNRWLASAGRCSVRRRELSDPAAEDTAVLRLVCIGRGNTGRVLAVFKTVAPGSTVVVTRTQDCPPCMQLAFAARVTVRNSA
jgi:hypothetical protein